MVFFFFKQKTAYEIKECDWSSDVCSSDLKPDEWVQVPSDTIPGTGGIPIPGKPGQVGGVKKYGAIAGKWVPGPLWNDIRQIAEFNRGMGPEWFQKLLRAFKIAKTALTPKTHINNVMANTIMAEWEDLRAKNLLKAADTMLSASRGDKQARAVLDAFEDAGAAFGSYAIQELRSDILDPLQKELQRELNALVREGSEEAGMLDKIRAVTAIDLTMGALAGLKNKAIDVYQFEDNVFRLALFIQEREAGASDEAAAQRATEAFLDYDINAPWVNIARRTGLPFIAFTYRAIPKLHKLFKEKPYKLLKLGVYLNLLGAAGYALSGGDEDEERATLPKRKQGRVLGFYPRLIRMPWNRGKDPVYLDITRWIPGGDIFFTEEGNGIPIPTWLSIGGPLQWGIELLTNQDSYTGKKIWLETDTASEAVKKTMGHLYRGIAPNNLLVPGSYDWEKAGVLRGVPGIGAESAKIDPFGREYPLTYALAGTLGINIAAYPKDAQMLQWRRNTEYQLRELNQQIGDLGRLHSRGGINREVFDKRAAALQEKMKTVITKYQEREAAAFKKK